MAYKIDIHHRQKNITFGQRFKGESGKDIFAVKVALGLLSPIPESGELESGAEVSYDTAIPLDQQNWFDCSTGLGVDIVKAAKFDSTLENALLTYQIKNQFLITVYYFEKYGFQELLNAGIEENTVHEAVLISQISAAQALFESELGTLGEATIAIMHGWIPATRLVSNSSYTHDPEVYPDPSGSIVYDLVPLSLYESLQQDSYPQNFEKLVQQGLAVPDSLRLPVPELYAGSFRFWRETAGDYMRRVEEATAQMNARRFELLLAGEFGTPEFKYGFIGYYPILNSNSALYIATTKVIDYYLENNLFSQTLSPEEVRHQARRAIYPDPFSRKGPFIIDSTKMGMYLETDYVLGPEGPLPPAWPSNFGETIEKIKQLEEQALLVALKDSRKPEVWNFFKDEVEFQSAYFANSQGNLRPEHSGLYPINITAKMIQEIKRQYPDLNIELAVGSLEFKKDNYWILSTSDVVDSLDPLDKSIQHWRTLEGTSNTEPLIKFVEFITPSLRPGDRYRALFEINRKKFDIIINGDNINQEQEPPLDDDQESAEGPCLDQNTEQAMRTYEEYKVHAIKRRRELVRQIREALQDNTRTTVDFGGFDSVFEGLSIDSYNDQQVIQKLGQLLPTQDLAELLGEGASDAVDWFGSLLEDENANPDEESNILKIEYKELEERIETAIKDLKEAGDVIRREQIQFSQESNFNAHNEASKMKSLWQEIRGLLNSGQAAIRPPSDKTEITFKFTNTKKKAKTGHLIGKRISTISVGSATATAGTHFTSNSYEVLYRPRTVNYLSKIKDMTFFPKLSGFFDDSRGACKDLGISLDKMAAHAYVKKYTSGLTILTDTSEGFSFKSWFEESVKDPLKTFAEQSAENTRNSLDPGLFDRDAALRALGEDCKKEEIWKQIFDRLDPVSLLCDYVKCLDLPAFDIRFPDFRLDPFPGLPIVGWYAGLMKFLREEQEKIIERIGCTIGRMIIDKLAFPFCQEQLNDFIRADLESTDYAKRAVIEALTRTGVPGDKSDEAKSFFDAVSSILTGKELCYLLAGNRPDNATMASIRRLAEATGVTEDLETEEDIVNFFGVIGIYIPEEICEALNQSTTVITSNCEETTDYLQAVRNRLQSGDSTLTDQEIENAVAMAERNKQEEADRLKSLFENGFSGLVPPVFEFGNPDALMSDFPDFLKKEQEKSTKSIFSGPRSQYVQGLSQYVPAMYVSSPMDLWPYDERYDEVQVLRVEAAIQQLEDFAASVTPDPANPETGVADTTLQYANLHQLYQTEFITSISKDLVPAHLREDLELLSSGKYRVPHNSSTLVRRIRFRDDGTTRSTVMSTTVDGSRVHRRMIDRGIPTREDISDEITALNIIISRYSERVTRVGPGEKRDRLRNQRRPFLRRRNMLQGLLDDPEYQVSIKDNIVDYEYFMSYQKNLENREFQELAGDLEISFKLVPHNINLYSTVKEYTNFSDDYPTNVYGGADLTNLDAGKSKLLNLESISTYFTQLTGITGDVVGTAVQQQTVLSEITERVDALKTRILDILQSRPPIIDELLFPGLQVMLDQNTENALERIGRESVEQEGEEYTLEFNAGSVYSPTIVMKEIPEAIDKDRFDITVKKDFFTGLGVSDEDSQNERTYKYCNQLPRRFITPGAPEIAPVYSKRYRFRNAVLDSLEPFAINLDILGSTWAQHIRVDLYKSVMESLFETLLDTLADSYLFDASGVEKLDKRVSGKKQILDQCVSNRFSFGNGSVVSFDDVIINNASQEIAKEMAKPENAPENQDFDSPTAYDWAMKNLAFRGFVRVCLIDVLLKGGIAYSEWDIEPIIGEKFFIDYVISHVQSELQSNTTLSESWGTAIERVTGITNQYVALESLVREELLKLSNYSKQVFNPTDSTTNFYNWFFEKHILQCHVSPLYQIEQSSENIPQLKEFNRLDSPGNIVDAMTFPVSLGKQKFIIEHYIEIRGSGLVSLAKETLNIEGPMRSLILHIDEFIEFLDIPEIIPRIRQVLSLSRGEDRILQGSRVVLIDPVPYGTQDVEFRGFDPNNPDAEVVVESHNQTIKTLRSSASISDEVLRSRSRAHRSFLVEMHYIRQDDEEESVTIYKDNGFAFPLVNKYRELDFNNCYSFETYIKDHFMESTPYMIQELSESEEFKMVFDHIFPVRRLMAIVSVFATSVVSGYNNMPTILTPAKQNLASLVQTLGMSRRQRDQVETITQEELLKQLTENFPTSEDACFEFPSGLGDFWNEFWEELLRLMRRMPSIIFRGVANQLDPAYKEMRQHYLNCDIKNLTYRGLRPAGTGKYKLTNGLYLSGRQELAPRQDVSHLQGKNKGKYVPLVTGIGSDIGYALGSLPDFAELGLRMGLMTTKLVSYIYSGNAPFVDPSFYFKIPCQGVDTGAWRDYGKYDAGMFGRYGHPLSPFTLLALATPQLESDKRLKENSCIQQPESDCEPISGEVVYESPARPEPAQPPAHRNAAEIAEEVIPGRRVRSALGCIPWDQDEIQASLEMIRAFEANEEERAQIVATWEEMANDIDYYDGRMGEFYRDGDSTGIRQTMGGKRRFREGERVQHPSVYSDLNDLQNTIGSSAYDPPPPPGSADNSELIHPIYYQTFIDLYLRYEVFATEAEALLDNIQTLARGKCEMEIQLAPRSPEVQEIYDFVSSHS